MTVVLRVFLLSPWGLARPVHGPVVSAALPVPGAWQEAMYVL